MTVVHCFTSASFAYLDRARVLGETLRRFHPDWKLWLCLPDKEPNGFVFDPVQETFNNVVRLTDLGIPDLTRWTFDHGLVELCTAVKGQMLCKLLDDGAEKVVYLDPDIALFDDLTPIVSLLDQANIILTPHQVEPDEAVSAILDNEIGSLKYGIYNLGFLAVAGTNEGRRFAGWWRDRLLRFCFDDVVNGLFTDQRWCDHVPVFFDGVHVLRNSGYNVASWNLSRRPITIEEDGTIRAAGQRLRFFHFTKVTHVGEIMLERYAADRIEVFELMKWYRDRLVAHAVSGLPVSWWAYGQYADGTEIAHEHRLAYRDNVELRERYPDPFVAGPGIFGR
jgi:hypothetical protein